MKISFIIVSWNTREKTCACIESIQKYMPEQEIVVVDNNSADDSCEQIKKRFPSVKLIENDENRGFGVANNQGVEIAVGDVCCFINSDAEVHDNGLESLAERLESDPSVGIIGPKVFFGDGTLQISYGRFPDVLSCLLANTVELFSPVKTPTHYWKLYWGREFFEARSVEWISGCCLLIKQDIFREAGMWDERYFAYCEDPALCRLVRRRGLGVIYDPSVKITHYHGMSFKQLNWVPRIKNSLRSTCIFLFDCEDCLRATLFLKAVRFFWMLIVWGTFPWRGYSKIAEKRDILISLLSAIQA